MLTVNDVFELRQLSGIQLLDSAARKVGMPTATVLAEPLTSHKSSVLEDQAGIWKARSKALQEHRDDLANISEQTSSVWDGDAAASFQEYSNNVWTAFDAHRSAVANAPMLLNDMKAEVDEADSDSLDAIEQIAEDLAIAVATAFLAVVIALAGLEGVALAIAVALVALLIAIIKALIDLAKWISKRLNSRNKKVKAKAQELLASMQQLKILTPDEKGMSPPIAPSPPLSGDGNKDRRRDL